MNDEYVPPMYFGSTNIQRTVYNPADPNTKKRHVTGLKALKRTAFKLTHPDADADQLNQFAETVEDEIPTPVDAAAAGDGKAKADDHENFENTKLSEGLSDAEARKIFEDVGPNALPEEKVHPVILYLRLLAEPMPIMIWIAIIVEGAIENWIDFGVLIAIQFGNASLSFYETTKAGNAVAALKKSLKPTAVCKRNGVWDHKFDATQLVPGDLVQLEPGNAVPADCIVNDGTIEVDESAMTGESLPVSLRKFEMAKMGGSVARGECEATVVFTGKETFFGRTAGLLNQGGNEKSDLQKLLIKIMVILTVLSVTLSGICFAYLATRPNESIRSALSFTVVLIVSSIPVAIEIVVTTTLALGSREMSSYGAIVSRLGAIEDLAGMNMLCSDKTGTLTKNKMMIQSETPLFAGSVTCDSQMSLLRYACLAARWESPPKDALDTLVLRCPLWLDGTIAAMKKLIDEYKVKNPKPANMPEPTYTAQIEEYCNEEVFKKLMEGMVGYERLDYTPFDPKVKRTEAVIRFPDGLIRKVTKGAPHVIGHLDHDESKHQPLNELIRNFSAEGIRAIAIAVSEPLSNWVAPDPNQPKDPKADADLVWHMLGLLTFLDPPRDDTFQTIKDAEDYGVPVRMITGDQILIAKKTAKDLQMGNVDREGWPMILGPSRLPLLDKNGKPPSNLKSKYGKYIENADGFAQVYPEHKYLIVETFRRLGYKTGMTGDGVNDAPALSRADVGIAVAGATDAARAAADIILTKEGLGTIVDAMKTSRKVFQRMKTFLTYRIAATLQLLIFFFIAVLSFEPKNLLPDDWVIEDVEINNKTVTVCENCDPRAEAEDWPEFFSMPVLMLLIITLLNDGTLISVGYDYTFPSLRPEKWNLKILFLISSFLGAMSFLSSLLLLWFLLDSWSPESFFYHVGLQGINYGQVTNSIYLKISISDFLTLFSARAQEKYFFQTRPHPALLIGGIIALAIATILALAWPKGSFDGIPVAGLALEEPYSLVVGVWIYSLVVFFLQDWGKVMLFRWIVKNNIFNYLALDSHETKLPDLVVSPTQFTPAGRMFSNLNDVNWKE